MSWKKKNTSENITLGKLLLPSAFAPHPHYVTWTIGILLVYFKVAAALESSKSDILCVES